MIGGNSNVSSWLNFAQMPADQGGLGLAQHQAAGLVGNLVNESGQNLSPWGVSGDDGTAQGTAQWRGDRLASLKQMFPDTYQTPQAQQAFMRSEFMGPENGAYKALLASQSPEEAAGAVNHLYERSADNSGNREKAARQLMAQFGSKGPSGALALSSDDDEEDTPAAPGAAPALSTQATLGTGALTPQRLLSAPKDDDKLSAIAQGLTGIGASLAGISSPQQAYALNQQLQSMKKSNEGKFKVIPTKDGRILRVDDSGNVDVVGSPTGGAGTPTLGDPTKSGADYLATLSPSDQQIINSWHEGTGVMPSSISARSNPQLQAQIAAAMKAYPDMDFTNGKGRQTMASDLALAAPSKAGGQVSAANASLAHLDHVADSFIAMNNGSGGGSAMLAHAQNAIGNAMSDPKRQGVIDALNNHSGLASGEITKVITNGPGGVHERAERAKLLGNPNYSPEEASAVLDAQASDMKAKYQETIDHVKATMGQSYLNKHPEIEKGFNEKYDALQAKIAKLGKLNAKSAPAPSGNRPPLSSFF